MIKQFIDPSEIAYNVSITPDNIHCYHIRDINLRIINTSEAHIGVLYTSDGKGLLSCLNGRKSSTEPIIKTANNVTPPLNTHIFEEEICVLMRLWSNNYFHFFNEIVDKMLICESINFCGKYMLFRDAHSEEIVELIGLSSDRIIWIDSNCQNNTEFLIKNCFEPEGFAHFSGRGLPYLCRMADTVTSMFSQLELQNYPKYLFVKRIGRRKLLNCEEVLKKYNFFTMIPEEHSILDEIKYFYCADVVVCPHGAALSNILFMRAETTFFELFPMSFINPLSFFIADYKNIHYHMLVEGNLDKQGITIDQSRDYRINELLFDTCLKDVILQLKKQNNNKMEQVIFSMNENLAMQCKLNQDLQQTLQNMQIKIEELTGKNAGLEKSLQLETEGNKQRDATIKELSEKLLDAQSKEIELKDKIILQEQSRQEQASKIAELEKQISDFEQLQSKRGKFFKPKKGNG